MNLKLNHSQPIMLAAALVMAFAVLQPVRAQSPTGQSQTGQSGNTIQDKLDQAAKLAETSSHEDSVKEAALLKGMKSLPMNSLQREDWLRYARDLAIRLGDLAWLKQLSKEDSKFPADVVYEIMVAYGKITVADLAGADKILNSLKLDDLSIRDQRRVFGLKVRIAELRKDPIVERKFLDKMIEHLPAWPAFGCQQCHDDPTQKGVPVGLPLDKMWFGEKYILSLKKMGDAGKVLAQAKKELQEQPDNDLAKMRIGYALAALGKKDESIKAFSQLPYYPSATNHPPVARQLNAYP